MYYCKNTNTDVALLNQMHKRISSNDWSYLTNTVGC